MRQRRNWRTFANAILLSACLLWGSSVWGQGTGTNNTNFSTSGAEIDTYNTTNVTQQVNTYQVELKARMQGGGYLFDQTYNVPYTDPSIATAITQAKNVLTAAGAASFSGPAQLSSNQTLVSSVTNTVQTGSSVTGTPTSTFSYIGPLTIFVGDHGICQSYVPSPNNTTPPQLTGCSLPGSSFAIAPGAMDIDTLIVVQQTINQTATTTNTNLTRQVYELVGVPATSPPPTPLPPSLLLVFAGLGSIAVYSIRHRLLMAIRGG